jgi:two-component system, LytTR family, response regulator
MKAAIVDDEPRSIEMLEWLLAAYCPEVEVAARFHAPEAALADLPGLSVDVLFCDIAMPTLNGFDLLLSLPDRPFSIVFITAHNGPIQRALKNSGADFLLKPIDDGELTATVHKIKRDRPTLSQAQLTGLRGMVIGI